MINDIKTGIAAKLNAVFDTPVIYTEKVRQGFEEPCFYIGALSGTRRQLLGERNIKTFPFVVQFFPASDGAESAAINETAMSLYEALAVLELESGSLRGLDMNHDQTDGILSFYVDYRVGFAAEEVPGDLMTDLTIE